MPRIELDRNNWSRIDISAHDIATVEVDAIVNSAGSSLKGGGGVDGAIHRAAGPALVKACAKLAPCPVGSVRVTNGFKLMTRFIVHTVAPRSQTKNGDPEALLASCYTRSVEAADYFGARTLVAPAIGGGVRGFPLDTVARIAMKACRDQLSKCRFLRHLEFCLTDPAAREAFSTALDDVGCIVPTRADTWEGSYFGEFDFRFIYVAVIEQDRHEWVFLARTPQRQHRIVYASDSGAVIGSLEVASATAARKIVRGRGFEKWGPDTKISSLMPLPWWPLYIPT